ncbi:CHAT domain-containing protein [Lentzea alba]|uniref:CHAT domain-containing protein n=1 Tax=Lentzea alba TaxID=2714351 RepID=UPI0039BF1E0F
MELIVHGKRVDSPKGDEFAELYGNDFESYQTRGEIKVAGVRNADAEFVGLDGASDDVIEVVDTDGVVSFHRADRLAEAARDTEITDYLESETRSRGSSAGLASVRRVEVTLPPEVAANLRVVDQAVGVDIDRSGLVDDALGVVANPIATWTARKAMREVVEWIDKPVGVDAPEKVWRRKPKPRGVYKVDDKLQLHPKALLDAEVPSSDKPYLVLLHGTFSHTEGAFGALRDTPEWLELVKTYEGRILAVEHATLSMSPVENALQAAEFLPAGTPLHLVSHSRGGLVGEVLSYASKQPPNLNPYKPDSQPVDPESRHPDLKALPKLHERLTERKITVERFVRVACPARGTTLASHRLDKWGSFLFNAFNLVPGLSETGIAFLIKKFLMTVLEQRTDPRIVPGIEAMMPEAPFLRMLLTATRLDDGLGSIAGDVQGSGIRRNLLVRGMNLFFREDHDFVVPTSSMSGGARRKAQRTASFRGTTVSHGKYFSNSDSRQALLGWLKATSGQSVALFEDPTITTTTPRHRDEALVEKNTKVIVVPDLLGSRIKVGEVETWPDVAELASCGVPKSLDGQPNGLVNAYGMLADTLATPHEVLPFSYAPTESPVERLTGLLAAQVAQDKPVHVVAHGLGALLVLEALRDDDLRKAWRGKGGRAVLLGPPLQGSWLAKARLAGRDEFTAALALLSGAESAEIGQQMARWPLMELLKPRETPDTADWTGITAVYGSAELTASGVKDGDFTCSTGGDGFAMPTPVPGLPTLYAVVPHADLPGDRDVAACVLNLLEGKTPAKLLNSPPAVTIDARTMPESRGRLLLPTDAEIVRMAWGGGSRTSDRQVLRVCVMHGDLGSVQDPVLVGHQDGTPVGGAEKALDTRLKGALIRRLELRQYPGPLNTCEVFEDDKGPAGVVIGIGDAGDLTPRGLTASVIQAVLRLVAESRDRGATEPLALAAVLVGTALVPAMPVENSLTAIVTGVRQANRRLRDVRSSVFVDELKIVELYEDRAIQATRAAINLAGTLKGDGGTEVVVEGRLLEGEHGTRGMPRPDYHDDTWRTVRIVAAEPGQRVPLAEGLVELTFTSIGRDAGVQQRVSRGQRRVLDELVSEAIDKPVQDHQLFNTLYELLVPNALKEQGYGSEHLSVVVDEQAGVLPLEMLASRSPDEDLLPLAVQVGVLRRLETRTTTEGTRPSSGKAALVIGDPAGTGLKRLPAARREAELVRDVLHSKGYEVTAIIPGADADAGEDVVGILNALFAREYRIIHIAGHGNYDPDDVTRSGVRIGLDTYLGPLEIAKMRTTPDLVFMNCCHLGAMRSRTRGASMPADRFASSISRQLVDNGVRAVIAAGWAVDDRAAYAFADRLYDSLLSGRDLGSAVLQARQRVYREFPATNTWGAYQVYGPPAFRLVLRSGQAGRPAAPIAQRELRDRLDELKRRAETCRPNEVPDLAEELQALRDVDPQSWLGGRELSDIGDVWGLLARYDRAMECYEAVLKDWSSAGTLKTLEQLVNVKAKSAVELVEQSEKNTPDALGRLAEAEDLLNWLLERGRTPERLSMLGSLASRRARCSLSTKDGPVAALAAARDAYGEAADLHQAKTGEVYYYPTLNQVVRGLLAHLWNPEQPFVKTDAKKKIADAAKAAREISPSTFWSRVTEADALLARALVADKVAERAARVTAAYEEAFLKSSSRDRATVLENLDIIAKALPGEREQDAAALQEMRKALAEVTSQAP